VLTHVPWSGFDSGAHSAFLAPAVALTGTVIGSRHDGDRFRQRARVLQGGRPGRSPVRAHLRAAANVADSLDGFYT